MPATSQTEPASDTYYSAATTRTDKYVRSTRTTIRLKTGGKALSHRLNRFHISATAHEIRKARWRLGDTADAQPESIPSSQLNVASLGQLGSDGNLYVALADNMPDPEITVLAPKNYYQFNIGVVKHRLVVQANGDQRLGPDRVMPFATNCVGQRMDFLPVFVPEIPVGQVQRKDVQWVLTGPYVNESWQHSTLIPGNPPISVTQGSVNYRVNADLLRLENTYAWWIDRGQKNAACSLDVVFANGQRVKDLFGFGKMWIYRPRAWLKGVDLRGAPTFTTLRPPPEE